MSSFLTGTRSSSPTGGPSSLSPLPNSPAVLGDERDDAAVPVNNRRLVGLAGLQQASKDVRVTVHFVFGLYASNKPILATRRTLLMTAAYHPRQVPEAKVSLENARAFNPGGCRREEPVYRTGVASSARRAVVGISLFGLPHFMQFIISLSFPASCLQS